MTFIRRELPRERDTPFAAANHNGLLVNRRDPRNIFRERTIHPRPRRILTERQLFDDESDKHNKQQRVLSIDDWASRKGHRYGIIPTAKMPSKG